MAFMVNISEEYLKLIKQLDIDFIVFQMINLQYIFIIHKVLLEHKLQPMKVKDSNKLPLKLVGVALGLMIHGLRDEKIQMLIQDLLVNGFH